MEKIEALERINTIWNDQSVSLYDKIVSISNDFYDVGLSLVTTATFIKATPAELDALLSLGGLSDEMIELISKANPPKTTWPLLANASDEEIKQALASLPSSRDESAVSEFVYHQMIEIAGPTPERMVGMLSGNDLAHALKKGQDFKALTDREEKFMKSVSSQKRSGKTLSDKQIKSIIQILVTLSDKGAITRNSIDGDSDVCDRILDAIGK